MVGGRGRVSQSPFAPSYNASPQAHFRVANASGRRETDPSNSACLTPESTDFHESLHARRMIMK